MTCFSGAVVLPSWLTMKRIDKLWASESGLFHVLKASGADSCSYALCLQTRSTEYPSQRFSYLPMSRCAISFLKTLRSQSEHSGNVRGGDQPALDPSETGGGPDGWPHSASAVGDADELKLHSLIWSRVSNLSSPSGSFPPSPAWKLRSYDLRVTRDSLFAPFTQFPAHAPPLLGF